MRFECRTGANAGRNPFIFDRFYKSDKSAVWTARAWGLGLYIAKMLVNMNRGRSAWSPFRARIPNSRSPWTW